MRKIDNREFVVTYLTSVTVDDVAKAMGMSRGGVISKATYLRKLGVKLPKKNSRPSQTARELEIAQLNSLIKKYTK